MGTETDMNPSLQDEAVAEVPLKVTELVCCVAPKPEPLRKTSAPTGAEDKLRLERVKLVTVKEAELLEASEVLTTTCTDRGLREFGT